MSHQEPRKKWQQIVAKAWADDGFKEKLLKNPATVLREEGFEVPRGVEARVVENTEKQFFLVLPAKPRDAQLTDEQLEQVAGGAETVHLYLRSR